METILIKVLQFILSLSLLIFVHELGHFFWARLFKVRVEKFYMFFDVGGRALWRWKPKGSDTEYGIGWLPFGGYCKIAGMVDESMDKEQLKQAPQPWEFRSHPAFHRFMIMVGGVLNNLILAVLIYICMMWYWGADVIKMRNIEQGLTYSEYAQQLGFRNGDVIWSVDGVEAEYGKFFSALMLANEVTVKRDGELITLAMPDSVGEYFLKEPEVLSGFVRLRFPMVVGQVDDSFAVAKSLLMAGDSIVAVNGISTPYADDVKLQLQGYAGGKIQLSYIRNGALRQDSIPVSADARLGIYMKDLVSQSLLTHVSYNFWQAIPAGAQRGYDMLYNYVRQFKLVFTKTGAQSLGGFGTMTSIFPESWHWMAFWNLTAFFSVALAFMNILPIPALDGGHIMFLLIEVIIRRKPSDRVLEVAQYIGFFIIMALLVFVNANDIYKFLIKPLFD